jgi:hypothetical protein
MCPYGEGPKWDDFCPMCRLIAQVREEMQAKVDKWRSLCAEQGDAYDEGVAWGGAESIAAAVQRVEAIPTAHFVNHSPLDAAAHKTRILAAIKGDKE